MQVHPGAPAIVAAITATLFVAGGLLAMHHEASTPHIRDRAGAFVHVPAVPGDHACRGSDLHSQRDPGGEAGDCLVLTAFHQAVSADVARPMLLAWARTPDTPHTSRTSILAAVMAVYRLAPKTSPPTFG